MGYLVLNLSQRKYRDHSLWCRSSRKYLQDFLQTSALARHASRGAVPFIRLDSTSEIQLFRSAQQVSDVYSNANGDFASTSLHRPRITRHAPFYVLSWTQLQVRSKLFPFRGPRVKAESRLRRNKSQPCTATGMAIPPQLCFKAMS